MAHTRERIEGGRVRRRRWRQSVNHGGPKKGVNTAKSRRGLGRARARSRLDGQRAGDAD